MGERSGSICAENLSANLTVEKFQTDENLFTNMHPKHIQTTLYKQNTFKIIFLWQTFL